MAITIYLLFTMFMPTFFADEGSRLVCVIVLPEKLIVLSINNYRHKGEGR